MGPAGSVLRAAPVLADHTRAYARHFAGRSPRRPARTPSMRRLRTWPVIVRL